MPTTRSGVGSHSHSSGSDANSSPSARGTVVATPRTTELEFGGIPGAIFVMISLPITVFATYFLCNREYCLTLSNYAQVPAQLPSLAALTELWNFKSFLVVVGWVAYHAVLSVFLPGAQLQGTMQRDGTQLWYTMNGHLAFWVTVIGLIAGDYFRVLPLSLIYYFLPQLMFSAMIVAVALSVYVYASSFAEGALLALGGNSGNVIYDFFIGRELNPRICAWAGPRAWDIKASIELRAALIGWLAINFGMVSEQYHYLGYITPSIILVVLFQGFYVWDALFMEPAFLSTMDVISDGLGFMLCFGNIVWVPFIYSLQARYLVDHPETQWPVWMLVALTVLNMVGYSIFRGANSQKDKFRKFPEKCQHMEAMETKRGTKLLVSGFWGLARKINYAGDWLMSVSWCALSGYGSPIPYFYCVYFAILLIHRAMRDDAACSKKYGADWVKYKARVPYVFIPYVI